MRTTMVVCVLLGLLCAPALADTIGHITVRAQNGEHWGEVEFPVTMPAHAQERVQWAMQQGQAIRCHNIPDMELGRIEQLSMELIGDPAVGVNFAVSAGASDTVFTITSATLVFAPLASSIGYASAAVTVTDLDLNGASLTGLLGGKAYQATFDGGTLFASLIDPVIAPVGGPMNSHDRLPVLPTLWQAMPASVSNMQGQFSFALSANDSASGTSYFEVIVPEPASLALLGLGALVLRRRR